ncbi:MAG: hypothetical protein ACOYXM_14745 [Actinomycetota bacterium]
MRFEEMILQDPEGEMRVRFHPELTVLSGLGAPERCALTESLLGAVMSGRESTTLRCTDGADHHFTIVGADGGVTAHLDDGSPIAPPLARLAEDPSAVRSLMVLGPDDVGTSKPASREDEPPDLREARATLDELTAELERALGSQQAMEALQDEIDRLEEELRQAHDGIARREYAMTLAQLERVRAEAAAVQAGSAGIDADRHLLSSADTARELAAAWAEANARVEELTARLATRHEVDASDLEALAHVPAEPPAELAAVAADLQEATDEHDALDHRLQELSVSKLPSPSDPAVAELGLLDQDALWQAAERLVEASEAMQRVQVSLGGLEIDDMGPAPALVAEIEQAHADVEAAERAAAAARVPALGGAFAGVSLAAGGLASVALLLPVGLVIAAASLIAGVVLPALRRSRMVRIENAALECAEAPSYLAFHIRRVEASIDPKLREMVETTTLEHRTAAAAWANLVGEVIDVSHAVALRDETEAYNQALRNLGDTADEIEQLRRELEEQAAPRVAALRDELARLTEPYLLDDRDLADVVTVWSSVQRQCEIGAAARAHIELDDARVDEQKASSRLEDLLLQLGFDAGPLDARVGALEWAVTRAAEREDARANARPIDELEAELRQLEAAADALRRPEWATVTAADAETPDIPELEARRAHLMSQLTEAHAEVDVERLADRKAAVERRVAALEARYGAHDAAGDPEAIAELQKNLLGRLTAASSAGPDGDPVPVLLDEVLLRVPADRKWDLLDVLHRHAEQHQLVYLSDDAFVAAWARQRALDGAITLLETVPEAS